MAPHDTNTKREARRHRFPLIAMLVIVALTAIGFFWWVGYEVEPTPEDGVTQEEPAPGSNVP